MSEQQDNKFGAEIYGPGKRFFDDVAMDNLMEAFLELTATVWTYHDRNLVLERVLQNLVADEKGQNLQQLIEQYQPTAEDRAQRKAEREKFVATVFQSFAKRPK